MIRTWEELDGIIKRLTNDDLIEVANEISDFQKTGVLTDGSFLGKTAFAFQISVRDVEYYVLEELTRRYKKLVLLLLKNRTKDFLAKE